MSQGQDALRCEYCGYIVTWSHEHDGWIDGTGVAPLMCAQSVKPSRTTVGGWVGHLPVFYDDEGLPIPPAPAS